MSFADKTLTCRDCGREFSFTAGEQQFYAQKGFDNEPTRCPDCRRARKAARGDAGGYSDRSYNSYNERSYGDRGYNERSYGGYGQRERVQHETVCSQCGRTTTVPFVPRGDRPVYCQECFAQQRGGRGLSRGGFNRY
ncbi:zinc-ribbon domain containing protein [Kallotenue papyrolyticum]|uniref:zinc-ribbon domain containing protein n=1 Tax=Kallotenue papyrolyticum TaxID=1325125 RepID=UPI00047852DB|nr:zinc-ribbon domain containing protein [Kallotenue papyrolyticum]